jgi:hypothetical protein
MIRRNILTDATTGTIAASNFAGCTHRDRGAARHLTLADQAPSGAWATDYFDPFDVSITFALRTDFDSAGLVWLGWIVGTVGFVSLTRAPGRASVLLFAWFFLGK